MPRPRILPADTELIAMRDQGLTHQQIADEVFRRTGHKVSRSTVSVALMRAGEAEPQARYRDTIPWTVRKQHDLEYPLRMLRFLGRRRNGKPMTSDEETRLDSWLAKLAADRTVVVYCPDAPEGEAGFHYVDEAARDHKDAGLPIRKEPVTPGQIGY